MNEKILNKPHTFSATGLEHRVRRYDTAIRGLLVKQSILGRVSDFSRGARHASFFIRLSNPLQLNEAIKLAEPLALSCGVNAVLAQRVNGLVGYQVQLPELYWQSYTRADVTGLGVGLGERRRVIEFKTDNHPHALVAGTTGSGKSETVKTILIALMTTYKPSELGVVLIGPKKDYADFENEEHLIRFDFGSIAYNSEYAAIAIAWVNQELTRRIENNIDSDRAIVLVLGEAHSVVKDAANLQAIQNIAKQARKYNVFLVCETQYPTQKELPGILDLLLNRFIGQLSDAKTSANVTGHAGLMAHKLTGRGDFLHINGPESYRFQVAQTSKQDYARLNRVEVAPVIAEPHDVIELPSTRPAGRPKLELSPKWLAYYFFNNPDKISHKTAQELGLTKDFHLLHRDFCREFIAEYLRLRNSRMIGV